MFNKVLIANRGAIAVRVIRTLKKLGIASVAIYHEQDAESLHVRLADEAIPLGDGSVADTYLNIDKIIDIAKNTRSQAIHPGYGFLSENAAFVARCETEDVTFIGPTAEHIRMFGLKHEARARAERVDVPMIPGSELLADLNEAKNFAQKISYPVMLKSTAGGGGIGMQVCRSEKELIDAWDSVRRLSENFFSNKGVFIEKYIERARHIEVQVFGDGQGKAVSFGERDCSAQRRNQKVVEETPAPNITEEIRAQLWRTAENLMAQVAYRNAGTVEFIYDNDASQFYFLEVNTRLQVEHGVSEEVWNVDLVEWMVKQAADALGDIHSLRKPLEPKGHALQVRVYSENPLQNFQPSAGLLSNVEFAKSHLVKTRVDTWIESGMTVPALFDPMIAKVITHGENREIAMQGLSDVLDNSLLYGIETNLEYLRQLLCAPVCKEGRLLTSSLNEFSFSYPAISVLSGGTQTTIQDYPGRAGFWHVGVPPSGPMDSVSLRLANYLVGNSIKAAALEITLMGPTLKFHEDTFVAISGADIEAKIDDVDVATNTVHKIYSGQTINLGKIKHTGARAYLAIAGGFDCPDYLGSKSTFTLGQFGGHNGRAIRGGDTLRFNAHANTSIKSLTSSNTIADKWDLRVIYGPHGAPDFFTENDINTFFDNEWEVHFNSSRTGVRLIGPKPEWARETGGEAGLHPSNIHDNAYAFGSIDFTGDMPVILGPDGPSLGGFVCPATVIHADLWKLGQLKAGAKVRFIPVSINDATRILSEQNTAIAQGSFPDAKVEKSSINTPVVKQSQLFGEEFVFRLAGDSFLLLELGPMELDISRRLKIHALMLELEANKPHGVLELTPGIRSLQVHYDPLTITLDKLIGFIDEQSKHLINTGDIRVPTRTVHLPLSWDDEACKLAIEKYEQTVRPGAPWCPSNLEFIRRINGLNSLDELKEIVFDASYLVMGLGDVYLGAPVATPVDPSHRLVTTKYNPARTWTAENSVGIGGAYLCIYGMEGPGGYQFIGRTLQMWNRYRQTEVFDQPWLLRFFDQIKFYEVSHDELSEIRKTFPLGQFKPKIEMGEFSLNEYERFIEDKQSEIQYFQTLREQSFQEELEHWRETGQLTFNEAQTTNDANLDDINIDGDALESHVAGSVWKLLVQEGDPIEKGQTLMILESMKMEIEINAPSQGIISAIKVSEGQAVASGQKVIWIKG